MISLTPDEEQLHLREIRYAALDVETTGLSVRTDRILEIGIVSHREGEKHEEFSTLLNPGRAISKGSEAIHGIQDEMVRNAPPFEKVAPRVDELLRDAFLVGHNLFSMDMSFFNKELRNVGRKPLYNPCLDTYWLSKRFLAPLRTRSLQEVAQALSIEVRGVHRALEDARLALKIWLKLREILLAQGIRTVGDLKAEGLLNGRMKDRAQRIMELAKIYGAVWIIYQSPTSGRTERWIEPLSVRGDKIDAYCQLREDFRTFELKRILEIRENH